MSDSTHDLRAEISELRAQLDALRTSRRRALRLLGGAVVGSAAAVLTAGEAAANGAVIQDATNLPAGSTVLAVTGTSSSYGFGVIDNSLASIPTDMQRPAVVAHAAGHNFNVGLGATSTVPVGATGVVAIVGPYGGTGVLAIANGDLARGVQAKVSGYLARGLEVDVDGTEAVIGVMSKSGSDNFIGYYVDSTGSGRTCTGLIANMRNGDSYGIDASGTNAGARLAGVGAGAVGLTIEMADGQGPGIAVVHHGGNRPAVRATSDAGIAVQASGDTGVFASGASAGGVFSGGTGALVLTTSAATNPPQRTTAYVNGTLEPGPDGSLWWCTASGTPGSWQQLAGPGTGTFAGTSTGASFHAVAPTRVYDSRASTPAPGTLATGQTRRVSIADGRSPTSGAVILTDLVPAGATAITCNVTVADTTGAGFLTMNPGGVVTAGAASVNWFASGQILNNGTVVAIAADRTVSIVCGGSGGASTNVVVDVTGWFG